MKRLIAILFCAALLFGCATTQLADQHVEDMAAMSADFDRVMTGFCLNWPYISGAIDGAYEGRTFNVPSGHIELKEAIDKIVAKGTLGKYEKGKVATLWASLVTSEMIRWIKEFRPDILKLIPAMLINL